MIVKQIMKICTHSTNSVIKIDLIKITNNMNQANTGKLSTSFIISHICNTEKVL